jgi:NAD(P)-dependent dehydrogenase (short-subunit alcohol dehydrogenase family)
MKTVLITGATSGVGFETAKLFADKGYSVIAAGRNIEKAPKHSNIKPMHLDLLSAPSVETFIKEVSKTFDTLSGIIHAAGIVIRKPFLEFSKDDIFKEFQTHVFAPIELQQKLHSLLQPTASVLFINSTLALKPIADTAIYSAAKAAQASIVKSMALELAPIRVNGIYLGITNTPIHNFTSDQKKFADTLQPLARVAESEEVAKEAYHLFHSEWSTGALQVFDGGILLK